MNRATIRWHGLLMMAVLLAAILAVTGLFVVMRGGRGGQASTVSVEHQNPPADSVRVNPAAASTPETAEAAPAAASSAAPAPTGDVIRTVTVQGSQRLEQDTILAGVPEGEGPIADVRRSKEYLESLAS